MAHPMPRPKATGNATEFGPVTSWSMKTTAAQIIDAKDKIYAAMSDFGMSYIMRLVVAGRRNSSTMCVPWK